MKKLPLELLALIFRYLDVASLRKLFLVSWYCREAVFLCLDKQYCRSVIEAIPVSSKSNVLEDAKGKLVIFFDLCPDILYQVLVEIQAEARLTESPVSLYRNLLHHFFKSLGYVDSYFFSHLENLFDGNTAIYRFLRQQNRFDEELETATQLVKHQSQCCILKVLYILEEARKEEDINFEPLLAVYPDIFSLAEQNNLSLRGRPLVDWIRELEGTCTRKSGIKKEAMLAVAQLYPPENSEGNLGDRTYSCSIL